MKISEIVAQYGLPVTVGLDETGYPSFTVVATGEEFQCECGWLKFVVSDDSDEYEVV